MLLFLIACLELNLALFNPLLVSHRGRTILTRDIAFSWTSGLEHAASKGEKILDLAGTHKCVVGQSCFTNCCPRRKKGKFQNALTADLRRVSVDGRKRYENGSVDADQLMRFR